MKKKKDKFYIFSNFKLNLKKLILLYWSKTYLK